MRVLLTGCLLFFSTACTAPSLWRFESISASVPAFDSARLSYRSSPGDSPLYFEMIRIGQTIEAFLLLRQYSFSSQALLTRYTLGDVVVEETAPSFEGKMKLRISPEMTHRIIETLQGGQKVSILVDGFEETLFPDHFAKSYKQLEGETFFWQTLFKGPMQ